MLRALTSITSIAYLLLHLAVVHATIFDNRFIPFLQRPYIIVPGRPSHAQCDVFFATASEAFGEIDREIGLPELFGRYNQNAVAQAFVALGLPNPLPSRFQNRRILWQGTGKLEAQGLEFSARKRLFHEYYAGFYWYFMRVNTTSAFFLDRANSNVIDHQLELDRLRRKMNILAGLCTGDHASQVGVGDIDAYFMWQDHWDYMLKFRSIWAQASVGVLVPSGQSRNIDEPTSIPFGGDGFWGAYIAGQGEFEVKEDWKFGIFLRVSKRFGGCRAVRVPICDVPAPYSPFISNVDINPGPTLVFSAWANFENLHKGLGARILLTTRRHFQDSWDVNCTPLCMQVDCNRLSRFTSWGSDYITLNLFYDFGKTKVSRNIEPIIFLAWDIPSSLQVTEQVYKTNKVMLGIECSF